MKKVFGLIVVFAFALAFVSCGNKAKEEAAAKAKMDSTRMADSVAVIVSNAAAQAKADSAAAASMAQAKADSIAAAAMTKKKR